MFEIILNIVVWLLIFYAITKKIKGNNTKNTNQKSSSSEILNTKQFLNDITSSSQYLKDKEYTSRSLSGIDKTLNSPRLTGMDNSTSHSFFEKTETSSMPHAHRQSGSYDTFNKKSSKNDSGTMPHKHEKNHYTSMADASHLPKGYILLNGEPVKVSDLEKY